MAKATSTKNTSKCPLPVNHDLYARFSILCIQKRIAHSVIYYSQIMADISTFSVLDTMWS